jgi:hypothetical protein
MFHTRSVSLLASVGFAALLSLAQTNAALAATAPPLGAADTFGVLAALSMSAAGAGTNVSGDLGLSPGLAVSRTGLWFVTGTQYFGPSSLAFTAQGAALSAFNNLAGQASNGPWGTNPWSPTPGVWTVASDVTFAGTITLTGTATDVWVFQVGRDMTFSGSVIIAGPVNPCNVFWQIGRSATIASGSTFAGTLIASADVTLVSGANVQGRIISLNSSLTTDGNNVSVCSLPPLPGSITINKTAVGGDATFGYTGSAALGAPFNIITSGGAGSHGTTTGLLAGAYTVTESTVPAGWSQTGLACTDSTAGSTFTYSGAQADIALAANGTVTCTYTNVRQGSITINKTAVGGNATFGYTGSTALGAPFNIITSGGAGSHGPTTGLLAGAYTVTESTLPAGWSQTGLACTDSTAGSTFTYSGAQANIALAAGGTVTCTYINNLPPPIPTLSEWGVIIFVGLVGLMSIYYLRRKRREA